ncbi:carbohydrate ABC transporter membrane protein 1, CUT1 family [Cohnella sp. OV330]|uniref:ABC transporter permease n=1 Tax=Cohnella sp. OV330 TaxID=1855288 RepID=UPI0008EAECE5|nr:ABC transporter permease subunit [Cohnella sp. OV330]SFB48339.1 carbohydrate ABC transporter membrane protein 1, CUT1 family [Cohnella sp. OV330]
MTNSLRSTFRYLNKKKYLYLMLLPGIAYFLIFNYIPMYGVVIAFKDFNFARGILHSPWIGMENFKYMFGLDDFYTVFLNSLYLSFLKLLFGFPFPILLALFLNEMRNRTYQKFSQTLIYLPHFISWVVIGGILVNFLSPTWGVFNLFLQQLGIEPVFFLADNAFFRPLVVLSSIWKDSGWESIIYLAAMASINTELYEAASIDGASRLKRLWHITVPGIKSTIVVLIILRLGHIMNNGFEQIFVLQNPMNLHVSEVFETYAYRVGILGGRFSFGATVGLFTSAIGLIFLIASNRIAKWMKEDGIW